MKTSNKLLIAFASALILIPILGMVYVSRVNYKVGKPSDIVEHKIENFSTPTANMSSVATAMFNSVNVADAHGASIDVRYVVDEKSGIKVAEEDKDLVSAKVDANGQLQIAIKADVKERNFIDIIVYAPSLKDVNINNTRRTYLRGNVDSLIFNVKKAEWAGIDSRSDINHLTCNAIDVEDFSIGREQIKSLTVTMDNANFRSEGNSYDALDVTTKGESTVEIIGDYDGLKKFNIQNLNLNTLGKTDVKLVNIQVIKCTGSLSDETNVQMPAAAIKQMFRK
ncbi:MAG: hypothetical protein REI78_07110 [Pedobacter sp.]|nr:hypothetical protein [Pedobacter sp.]MDQ8052777.1 hypothetical protein [Pedobacter sp.]